MDYSLLKQLKESRYRSPQVTDVILDYNIMLDIVTHSIGITEYGYDTVIDSMMFNFLVKYFKHGIDTIDKRIEEKGIRLRMVIDANKENIDFINAIKHYDIKHADGIKGNFGIYDKRAYMVFIFHKESEHPDQTLWSNYKTLVDKQQRLFDNLWKIAIPLSARNKEIEIQKDNKSKLTIFDKHDLNDELVLLAEQCRRELLILSSTRILHDLFFNNPDFIQVLNVILKRGISVKILADNVDKLLLNQFAAINEINQDNYIQFGYSNRLGDFNELVVITDSKYTIQVEYDKSSNPLATFSNEEHTVLIQEILFEKYWNEIKSLAVMQNN